MERTPFRSRSSKSPGGVPALVLGAACRGVAQERGRANGGIEGLLRGGAAQSPWLCTEQGSGEEDGASLLETQSEASSAISLEVLGRVTPCLEASASPFRKWEAHTHAVFPPVKGETENECWSPLSRCVTL